MARILTTLLRAGNAGAGAMEVTSAALCVKSAISTQRPQRYAEGRREDLVRRDCLVYSACRNDPPSFTATAFSRGIFRLCG